MTNQRISEIVEGASRDARLHLVCELRKRLRAGEVNEYPRLAMLVADRLVELGLVELGRSSLDQRGTRGF